MLRTTDIFERVLVVLLSIPFVIAFAKASSTNPMVLLLVASEAIAVLMILIRKSGPMVLTPYAVVIGILGSAGPLLVRPEVGHAIVPQHISIFLLGSGLALNISAKLFLNRSFGMVAANRGVKRGGPYTFVRHPMYLGYVVAQMGFFLSALSWFNAAIYTMLWFTQYLRIIEEEKCLMQDETYRRYVGETRWRVIPGLY
jgi:protein-S-isoprenylcysteine O-methyltransferase Ste14